MEFYNKRANDFSSTRNSVWKCVRDFGEKIKHQSDVLDAGCGNGKNMIYLKKKTSNIMGFDNCDKFVKICKERHLDVSNFDILNFDIKKFGKKKFDNIICIAVVHHFKTESERLSAIKDLLKLLKSGGEMLLTFWAFETDIYSRKRKFEKGDNVVKFDGDERYYYVFDEQEIKSFIEKIDVKSKYIYWENGNWVVILKN